MSADIDATPLAKSLGLSESAKPVREMIPGWTKPRKIIVVMGDEPDVPARMAWLQLAAPGVQLVAVKNSKEAMSQIADANAILRMGCDKNLAQAGKALHWQHMVGAGMDTCFFGSEKSPDYVSGKIILTNAKRVMGTAISEHVIGLMLALTRGLDYYVRQDTAERFSASPVLATRLREVKGATMLVVGLGGIGTSIAEAAHGLGMKVIATRNSGHDGPDYVDYVGLPDELPALLGKADVVVLAVPLTPETNGMMNARTFALMKHGALLIDIARGNEIVTKDLIDALNSGQLGGAGLDVFGDNNELAPGDPLWKAPNLILTPHIASRAVGAGTDGETAWTITRENLRRFVAGDKLYSVVDPVTGY